MTCAMNCTVCNYMSVVCGIVVYYRIPLCTSKPRFYLILPVSHCQSFSFVLSPFVFNIMVIPD